MVSRDFVIWTLPLVVLFGTTVMGTEDCTGTTGLSFDGVLNSNISWYSEEPLAWMIGMAAWTIELNVYPVEPAVGEPNLRLLLGLLDPESSSGWQLLTLGDDDRATLVLIYALSDSDWRSPIIVPV